MTVYVQQQNCWLFIIGTSVVFQELGILVLLAATHLNIVVTLIDQIRLYRKTMATFSEQTVNVSISLQSVLESNQPNGVEGWLTTNGPDSEPGLSAIAEACRMGRLDAVEILYKQGYVWDVHACCAAAQYGHVDVLKYLHTNGCPWDEKAMIYAARGGQLECLKYLHEQGCSWDKLVFLEFIGLNYAVFMRYKGAHPWKDAEPLVIPPNGYTSCLQYALENGCPVHPEAFETFAYYGRLDCLQLMQSYGSFRFRCPQSEIPSERRVRWTDPQRHTLHPKPSR